MIISFINTKGGTGKTTTCINVARGFQLQGKLVAGIDSDPQGSARNWHEAGEGDNRFAVIGMDRPKLIREQIPNIAKNYDMVFIDGVAKDVAINTSIICISDIVILPLTPSVFDIWATNDILDVIKQRQEITNKPISRLLFTLMRPTKFTTEAIATVKAEMGMEILSTHICFRDAYRRCTAKGHTVYEGKDNLAIKEINDLIAEIKELQTCHSQ